jgi:transcriptional regulator with GAF, ATPase, and Fis domain
VVPPSRRSLLPSDEENPPRAQHPATVPAAHYPPERGKKDDRFQNGTSRFPEATAAAGRKDPCSVCHSYGYESAALIPIRLGNRILGLIHVADPRDDRVPQEMVQILEDGAMQLGAAIKRVRAEEELRKSNGALEERVKIGNSNPSMPQSGSICYQYRIWTDGN